MGVMIVIHISGYEPGDLSEHIIKTNEDTSFIFSDCVTFPAFVYTENSPHLFI